MLLQTTFSVAASLGIGSAAWFFLVTQSTKQMVYAPILLSGCSSSAMYAMALSFITDVIGQEKVCPWLTIQQCDEILWEVKKGCVKKFDLGVEKWEHKRATYLGKHFQIVCFESYFPCQNFEFLWWPSHVGPSCPDYWPNILTMMWKHTYLFS